MLYRPRLFTPGPVELHPKALETLSRPQLHHRSDKAGLEAGLQVERSI